MDLGAMAMKGYSAFPNAPALLGPHLFLYLQRRGIDICCLQETRFDFNFHEDILSKDYLSFSACFDGRSRGVTWLISRRLDATCALVLSDPAGRLCVVDVTINDKAFRLIGVYGPNATSELPLIDIIDE